MNEIETMELKLAIDRTTQGDWEKREYLGMSGIGDCMLKLYRGIVDGRGYPGLRGLMYCHEEYLHERDVIARLKEAGKEVTRRQWELVAPWDERFRGYIDGELPGGELLEIKSVNRSRMDQAVQKGGFRRHREQMQAYMRYGGYDRTFIVYKCREDGDIWVVKVERDDEEGERLEKKARAVLRAVDARQPPACTCGWCDMASTTGGFRRGGGR